MNIKKLKAFVQNNPELVTVKASEKYPELSVVKYKKKVFYDDLWIKELTYCRGLVVDKNFNVIVRPFDKIFNYGIERLAPKIEPDELVYATRKVNGFMLAVTWYKNEPLFSTTGSLDSDFVRYGSSFFQGKSEYWQENVIKILESTKGYTHLFECVHPEDLHIIAEPLNGLYYLGSMSHDTNTPEIYSFDAVKYYFNLPESYVCTMQELIEINKKVKHEGFVLQTLFDNQNTVSRVTKIKSPYYLITKALARKSNILNLLSDKAKETMPEEFYGLIDRIKSEKEYFTSLVEQDKIQYIRKYFGD